MAELMVRDWLADFKALTSVELTSYKSTINENHELIQAILTVLEDKSKYQELLEPICSQLFTFYQSCDKELQLFALQYLPTLIGVYLYSLVSGEKRNVRCIEVLLLGIYNIGVVDSSGKPVIKQLRLPSLAQPSIYHTPMSLTSASLTENALSRLEKGDVQVINIGPFPHVESLNAQNRMKVMTTLMNIYNSHLSQMPKPDLQAVCKMCTRVVRQGFGKLSTHHRSYSNDGIVGNPYLRVAPRINVTSTFLLEVLHAVYFAIFNGLASLGIQAVEDIASRASYEMMPDVLMVTSSIKNTLRFHHTGALSDGPMGISVALSPTTGTTTVSKSIITNASFRTRKLPDDIPIQTNKGDDNEGKLLSTINEENDVEEKSRPNSGSVKGLKEKSENKGMAPLIGMLTSKIEKSKLGGKKSDGGEQNLLQPPGGSKPKDKNDKGGSSSSESQRRRNSVDTGASSRSSRRESLGMAHNGDTADIVAHKNSPWTVQLDGGVEMKNLVTGGPLISPKDRVQRKLSTPSNPLFDTLSDRESLSSTASSLEEDKLIFHASNHEMHHRESDGSKGEMQTVV